MTKAVILTDNYQMVADRECTIQIKGGIARIFIGNEKPQQDTLAYFEVSDFFAYTGDEKVWIRRDYDPINTDIIAVVDNPVHPPY